MFYNNPKCEKISDRIFIFKNIIPKNMIDSVNKDLLLYERSKEENNWSTNDWYKDKIVDIGLTSTFPIWKFMSELIYPELVIHPMINVLISEPSDDGMFVHADSPGPDGQDEIYEIDQWSACCSLQYGMVAYFGEFTGGELFYPNINPDGTIKNGSDLSKERLSEPCLVIQPEVGDIILHGACKPYDHGTKKTRSGKRFVFSNFALNASDNPGTFYNYKTDEWYEQIGKYDYPTNQQLQEWNSPFKLNSKFAEIIEKKQKEIEKRKIKNNQ